MRRAGRLWTTRPSPIAPRQHPPGLSLAAGPAPGGHDDSQQPVLTPAPRAPSPGASSSWRECPARARPQQPTRSPPSGTSPSGNTPTAPRHNRHRRPPRCRRRSTPTRRTGSARAAQCSPTARPPAGRLCRPGLAQLAFLRLSTAPADELPCSPCRPSGPSRHLHDGTLLRAGLCVFDLDRPPASHAVPARLRPGHPWNQPGALDRLPRFYPDPAAASRPVSSNCLQPSAAPARIQRARSRRPARHPGAHSFPGQDDMTSTAARPHRRQSTTVSTVPGQAGR